jgi:hypothetical protein
MVNKNNNYKIAFWIVFIVLLILLFITKIYPAYKEWSEEGTRELQELIDYSNNWSRNFCIENGYEDYHDSNNWDYDYCKQGNLFIKFRKKWNYTGDFWSGRDKIVGGIFVPN